MNDGRIGLLYEGREGLYFARFYPEGSNLAAHSEGRFEHTGKFGWWPERHRQKLLETKQNQPTLIFVGDSITQNWEEAGSKVWNRYYTPRHAANYGFRGDSTQHVIWRIENGEFDGLNPRLIVLLIGTNNARHGDFTPDQIVQGIQTVVTRLQQKCPASRILLLSIFPRDADPGGAMRLKCEEVNTRLPGLADGSRVVHLNINPAFLSPEGTLPADVSPDHLHLSAKGYQIWAEAMEPTLEAILRKPSPNP
jgi:beta-glucosidase